MTEAGEQADFMCASFVQIGGISWTVFFPRIM
jgi:hypothetical protein